MIFALILALALIFVNAFYVAAEFATVAARQAQLQHQAQEGNAMAKRLLVVMQNPRELDQYIATCQIGITFSSLINGAVTESNLGPIVASQLVTNFQLERMHAASLAALLILACLTLAQILFGELLPKAVALQYSTRVALFMYWPLHISSRIYRPFIWILNGSGNALLAMFGIPASSHKHIHSLDEIELLLAESKDGGLLEPEEHERLHHAIELSQETAKQIMTPRTKLSAISVNSSLDECYQLALESPYTRLLVYGDTIDDVKGIVNVKSIVSAKINNTAAVGIEHFITPIPIVPENLSMDRLMKELKEHRSHAAIVMDEHGGTLGVVTVGDILGELMEETETDEFKREIKVEILEDGDICMSGAYKLRRATKFIGPIPDTEADTVNGLVMEILGRVPEEGESVEFNEVVMKVESVEHNAVTSLRVTKKTRADDDDD